MNRPHPIPADERKLIEAYFRAKPAQATGCPDRAALQQIARGDLPPSDPAYSHLTNCSTCFQLTERLHNEAKQKPRKAIWAAIVAVAASVIIAAIIWKPQVNTPKAKPAPVQIAEQPPAAVQTKPPQPNPKPRPKPATILARVDYSNFAPLRGGEGETRPTPTLPRHRGPLEIILPVASLTGRYEAQIVDAALVPQIELKGGLAALRNGQTILTLPICDLTKLKSGTYSLALKPPDLDWSIFPIEVR